MASALARQRTPTFSGESNRALRSAIEHSRDVATLTTMPDDELLRVIKKSTGLTDPTRLLAAFSQLSDAFGHATSVLQARASARILNSAKSQARVVRARLVTRKDIITSTEFAKALGVTRQALSKAVLANRLFVVEVGGVNYYPAFFADPTLERRQLERVAKSLGSLSGWEKWVFFTTPNASLGRLTPLAAIKNGKAPDAIKAALSYAQR